MKDVSVTLVHPIFLQCCEYLTDPFWLYIFEDLAYGKCPYGIVLQDSSVCCILKNKEFVYHYQDKAPQDVGNELCNIFAHKMNLLSLCDHQRFRVQCQNDIKRYMDHLANWNDIKRKNLRFLLLENFTLQQKDKWNYSMAFARKLYSLIFIGMQFRTILSKHIIYKNRKIQSIEPIECAHRKIICKHNIFICKQVNNINVSVDPYSHPHTGKGQTLRVSSHWKRYLASI